MILADEPTGNLDMENSRQVISLFKELAVKGKCIIMVTHNEDLAAEADVHYVIDQVQHSMHEI